MTAPAVTVLRASEDHADEALIKLLDYDTIQALKAMQNPEAAAAGADQPGRSIRQAAELLGVQPAFLRSLDLSGALEPFRSPGGHRRYSRHQLTLAARLRVA